MSRSIVAVEMLTVNKNGILEFKETPAIAEVIKIQTSTNEADYLSNKNLS